MPKLRPDQLDPRNNLQFYTREAMRDPDYWDDRAVRAEYSRLRDIAQKRLQRLAVSEPGSRAYRLNAGQYATARSMTTEEIREKLPQLARFIAAKTGSVSGIQAQRRAALETLQEHGFTGINKGNIKDFGEFMEQWRERKLQKVVGSVEAAEFFEWTQDKNIPWDKIRADFALWLRERETIQRYADAHEGASPAKLQRIAKYMNKYPNMNADRVTELFDDLEARQSRERAEKRAARRKR